MTRVYAIGDVHGHLDKLKAAHARIEADRAACRDQAALVVHVGDYVDRGPDSRGVLEYLKKGVGGGRPWIVLKGNHDRQLADFTRGRRDPILREGLTYISPNIGGLKTLESYGVTKRFFWSMAKTQDAARAAVPAAHVEFIDDLSLTHETEDLFFVHAGIRPGVPLHRQEENDLLWIRQPFLEDTRDHGKLIVHGHTALDAPQHYGNRVNIDGGTGFGRALIPAVFEGRDCWLLDPDGNRVRLGPPG